MEEGNEIENWNDIGMLQMWTWILKQTWGNEFDGNMKKLKIDVSWIIVNHYGLNVK